MPAEEFIYNLQEAGRFKEACDFLSYVIHRRAAVWWGYCCLLTLAEELEANPAVERDIADIGASKEPEVPEWAQVPPEELAEETAEEEELLKELKSAQATVDAELKKLQAMIPPHIHGQHHADH